MQLFSGIPDPDAEPSERQGILEAARQVDMRVLVDHLGCEWNRKKTRIRCPNPAAHKHGDRHPSAMVYPDHIYCYSCGGYFGVVDVVMHTRGVSFQDAIGWFADNLEQLGHKPVPRIVKTEYHGPAPREIVEYWFSCLTPDRRAYLHNRLINDDTIDQMRIGWCPDKRAYSIPFWRGVPSESEIDIVQFRLMEGDSRYISMRGFGRPSIIPVHRIGSGSVVMLFGTFDALLASQDGIAAISPNGANAFTNDDDVSRLKAALGNCKVYLVPDNSETELRPAYTLGRKLNAEIRHFPKEWNIKDYTEFRQAGGTLSQFMREALMIAEGFIKPEHDEWFVEMLRNLSEGNWDAVETFLLCLQNEYAIPAVVCQHIQLKIEFDPYIGLQHEQWQELRDKMTVLPRTYEDLFRWAKDACEMAHRNRGGF